MKYSIFYLEEKPDIWQFACWVTAKTHQKALALGKKKFPSYKVSLGNDHKNK